MPQTLKITIPDKPKFIRLIPVPSEKLEGEKPGYIQDQDGNNYKILQTYTFKKDEIFPAGLMLLATGKEVDSESIWKKYSRSERIYFFVCEKVKNDQP